MDRDLVIGVDSSTTATKAIAWDREGNAVAEGRSNIAMNSPQPLYYEQDAEEWWTSLRVALSEICGAVDPARIAALSIANQRETFVPVDADGEPLRPAILWLDERAGEELAQLSKKLGADRITQISGKTPNLTPCLYKIDWYRKNEPQEFAKTKRFLDVHGFLAHRLTGMYRTSWASADPLGVFDLSSFAYANEILDAIELSPAHFADAIKPGTVFGEVTTAAAEETGLPEGTLVVAGGGDGQAAGFGTGTLGTTRAYVNLGTACVAGVYGSEYATDKSFRTMASLSGDGYIFEICLRSGTFLTDWFVSDIFGVDPNEDQEIYQTLEEEAAELPVGADGLLLMPYWNGVMTPYWNAEARGAVLGLSAEHGRAHLYRAMMEGIALDLAMGFDGVDRATGTRVKELLTIGGGAQSKLWCQIIADATQRTVCRSNTVEATSLGAGIAAAIGAGWFEDARSAATSMAALVEDRIVPDVDQPNKYDRLRALYDQLFPATESILNELAAIKAEGRKV